MDKKRKTPKILRKRAIKIDQNEAHPVFLFSLTGEEILQVAEISKISRDKDDKLIGYQRSEVKRHIQEIVEYLDEDGIVFPNSIILALSSNVVFKESRGKKVEEIAKIGTLEIQMPKNNQPKPGWIVDGQQRALAISMSKRKHFPFPISAFIADEIDLQRDQFLRINNAKPLPRGLISELLPEVSTNLPTKLAKKKIPSELCNILNNDPTSPFFGLIKRVSTSKEKKAKAVITDTSIIKMIEESITSPSGCLFPYRNLATGETDFDGIWKVLTIYWSAVKNTFPEAWAKPPKKSRLMHGAGIRAVGRLMDRIMPSVDVNNEDAVDVVSRKIKDIQSFCHWTSGNWDGLGGLAWNEIQNVPRHINILSNFLIRSYIQVQ